MEGALLGAGLTKNEAKIYLALLKSGSALAGEITSATGIHRRNVYDAIERLTKKSMVGYIVKNGKKYFKATEPGRLLDIFEEQRGELKKKEDEMRLMIPTLSSLQKLSMNAQRVCVFEGIKGLATILQDVIETKQPNMVFTTSQQPAKLLPYLEMFHKKRIKAKIRDKMLSSVKDKERAKKLRKLPYTEVRLLPREYDSPLAINVYGNKVGMLIYSESPIGILIEDHNVAESFRNYFMLLWEMAEEL